MRRIPGLAARLGFTMAIVPPLRTSVHVDGLTIVPVQSLKDALEAMRLTKCAK